MTEQEVKTATLEHIARVQILLLWVQTEAYNRGLKHDETKLDEGTEFPFFVKYTPKLADCTYGSDEYKQYLKELQPALDHHYRCNSHHPEHFPNGIAGMNLIDLIEMFCDWIAAGERHKDGDIIKSIKHNKERFGYSDEIESILLNTANYFKCKAP